MTQQAVSKIAHNVRLYEPTDFSSKMSPRQDNRLIPRRESPHDIAIGVSACLLGAEVRYNGGHKLDRFVRDTLGSYMRFVPVCPEIELGLGAPRETLRLVQASSKESSPRLLAPKSGADHTTAMLRRANERCDNLATEDLCGFIVQKGSPSCGMERVRVYPAPEGGHPARNGRGLFTRVLMERFPHLPVEEDGRLHDPGLRENFIVRIFAYRRLHSLFQPGWRAGDIVAFHTSEKMLLLAHDRPGYTKLGSMVAAVKQTPRAAFQREYMANFLSTLAKRSSRRKNTDVLQHMTGHFKKILDTEDRRELRDVIESYRNGQVPLVVPVTLLRHHVRRHNVVYLSRQSYLEPHPRELMLRNHV